ncbi:MAG: di-heme oxidoredictase family protein [Acidimicrobiales bacterium]
MTVPPRVRRLSTALSPVLLAVGFGAWWFSASRAEPPPSALGGETTRFEASRNSFGLAAPTLTNTERRTFEVGDSFFTQNWVTAPASTDARDGLGPTMNARACSSCHVLDGRGLPPDLDDEGAELGLLLRLSIPGADPETGAPLPDPAYGGQLQDASINGVGAEGAIGVSYESIAGTYGDGTPYELAAPTYTVDDLAFGEAHPDLLVGPRLAPAVFGVGLLEEIPEADLLALADPDDADGDGISGRANRVWSATLGEMTIGRFGWKANTATVRDQVADAFFGDIGITSSLHPVQNCPGVQVACAEAIDGGDPELTDSRLGSVTFYNRTLAVPGARVDGGGDDDLADQILDGFGLFDDFGCSSCHAPTFTTGDSDIAALADQTIHPYTDLLLHDMGEGLADGRPDHLATGSEWRTPPLWGLGLIDDVNAGRFLLHDGRARTIEEAILWHGGEAETSREAFRLADAGDRAALVAFLEAL